MSYLLKNLPKSTREAIDTLSQDKVVTIVKNSIVTYLDNFLNTTGANRAIAETLGTSTLQYITDKVSPSNDPNLRPTQLAVLTEDLVEKIPCILVSDATTEWKSSGLGQKDDEYLEDIDVVQGFSFIYMVDINIFVVTHDEATTKDLSSLISLMFGPLQNIAGGSLIKSNDPLSKWEITLPLVLPAPTIEKRPIEGDTISQIWLSQFSIPGIKYENKSLIKFTRETVGSINGIADNTVSLSPEILFNSNIRIGQTVQISVKYLGPSDRVIVDNNNFVVSWEEYSKTTLSISGNRPGTFDILVINKAGETISKKQLQVIL